MKLIKPKKLNKGDLIGIISPASTPASSEKLEKGVKYLESLGYQVKLGKNVIKEAGYLAGKDTERLEDLHNMFEDKEIKAIFCTRGGYGSGRLLDKVDYSLVRKNPKIFVGYSDITALQMAFLKKAGLVSFAGPMLTIDFSKEKISGFTEEKFWKVLTSTKKIGKLQNPNDEKFYSLNKGRGEGQLIGGNLATLSSLMGTEYLPSIKDKILLLEDISEPPYKIDRMFYQLKYQKDFDKLQGLILGRFVDCYDAGEEHEKTQSLNEVITDYWEGEKISIIYNVKHGHIDDTITIPYGVNCKINSSRGFVEITEGAVI